MITKEQRSIIIKLDKFFKNYNLNYVVIGATVPSLLIDLKQGGTGFRGTEDVDYSIEVKSWQDFETIKNDLEDLGFEQKVDGIEHRFDLDNVLIDILPYGKNLQEEGVIVFPGTERKINVTGFDKLFKYSQPEKIDDDLNINIIPLPLLVFTKILAYQDRQAQKDLEDIYYVLTNYEKSSDSERRFEISYVNDIDYEYTGSFLLGKDLKELLDKTEVEIVEEFLVMEDGKYSDIIQILAAPDFKKEDDIYTMFAYFKKGFNI